MLLLWMAACAFLAWRYLDSLPALANRLAPGRVAGIAELSHTHSLRKQLAYHVDVWFSRSPYSKVLALLYLTLALVFIGALGLKSVTQQSFYSAVWETIAGVGIDWTFASLDDSSGSTWGGFLARSVAVLVSLGGLCITALMLGIVSEQISHVIEELKKGKSEVLESGHTLILGWSDKVATIVDQLCLANESEGGGPIVILADMPKEDMEEELRNHSIQFLGSHVVCRSGNPHLEMDLRRVSVITARATVVLSTCEVADQADARVLRTVLSLTGEHDRLVKAGGPGLRGHIVAELADIDNEPLVSMCGQQSRVFTVTSHDIIGRLMVQCARQPGLAAVWETLMGFRGDEFYLQAWPSLTGRRFAEVLLMFEYALPLGVKPAATGEVMMNPGDDYVFAEGDELLVLAEDDDTYSPAAKPALAQPGTCPAWANSSKPERILLVGWRRDLDDLIMAVDEFVTPGSEVHLYNDVAVEEREKMLLHGGLNVDSLQNLTLVYKERMMQGEVVDRKRLEDLRPEQYTSILILSDADNLGTVDSDSRCIAVALLLRDIQSSRLAELAMDDRRDSTGMPAAEPQVLRSVSSLGRLRNAIGGVSFTSARGSSGSISSVRSGAAGGSKRVQPSASMLRRLRQAKHQTVIIAEILDARAKRIVSELGICEFIMSSDIVSMALAMCAENPAVIAVLAELFTEAGNELYVHPVERYLHPEEVLTFYDIILRGRQKQHIILGYSERGTSRIVLNPKNKGSRFYSHDTVEAFVVLAESP